MTKPILFLMFTCILFAQDQIKISGQINQPSIIITDQERIQILQSRITVLESLIQMQKLQANQQQAANQLDKIESDIKQRCSFQSLIYNPVTITCEKEPITK